jgi:hypothetical protein
MKALLGLFLADCFIGSILDREMGAENRPTLQINRNEEIKLNKNPERLLPREFEELTGFFRQSMKTGSRQNMFFCRLNCRYKNNNESILRRNIRTRCNLGTAHLACF